MSASSLAEPLALPVRAESEGVKPWSVALRVAFRFVFSFLVLFNFPFPLDVVPFVGEAVQSAANAAIVAVGQSVFGIAVDTTFNGSGDRTANWIFLFIAVSLAVVSTLVWSIADRRATGYPRLWRWFHTWIRFALAVAMMGYGAFKVIPSQFVAPGIERLLQPIGDASPMGLLWTFMGASTGYTMFTGFGELIGGLLLTIRRTTLLGALISAGVMTHVVALNFFYDVPVKIYSSILLFTALVIAAPDAKKLLRFFILDRPVEPLFTRPALRIAARVLVVLFVGYLGFTQFKTSWDQRQRLLAQRLAKSPLSGVWTVASADTTNPTAWRRFIVAGPQWGAIQTMDDGITRYILTADEKVVIFKKRNDPHFQATMGLERTGPRTLTLRGQFDGKNIVATMHREDDRTFRLTSRGFHWINESPFNR